MSATTVKLSFGREFEGVLEAERARHIGRTRTQVPPL